MAGNNTDITKQEQRFQGIQDRQSNHKDKTTSFLGDIFRKWFENAMSNLKHPLKWAGDVVGDVVGAFKHPVETAKNFANTFANPRKALKRYVDGDKDKDRGTDTDQTQQRYK